MNKRSLKPIFYLVVFSLLLLSMVGCSSGATQSSQNQDTIAKPAEVNASYATRPINVPAIVALDKGTFEEAFQKEEIEFTWHDIAAGPTQLEALAAKDIDIATSMNYVSAILAKANGNDIKVVAGYSQFPKAIGIVGQTELNIKSITDLKGKKIALQKGTMLHELLIKALEKENMKITDVEMIPMASTDAVPALLGGQIDAAILPEPLLSKVIGSGKGTLIQTAEGLITGQTFIVSRAEFAREYPETIQHFIETHEECITWAEENQDEFYQIASKQLNLEPKMVQALYPKFVFTTKIDQNILDELKVSAKFLQENGFLKSTVDIDKLIEDLVDTSFTNN